MSSGDKMENWMALAFLWGALDFLKVADMVLVSSQKPEVLLSSDEEKKVPETQTTICEQKGASTELRVKIAGSYEEIKKRKESKEEKKKKTVSF